MSELIFFFHHIEFLIDELASLCLIFLLCPIFFVFDFLFIYFYNLLDAGLFAEDLPAHAEIVHRMIEAKSLFFYDRFWFSGWPAFQFYGFLPHLLTAITSLILSNAYSIESIIRFYSLLACCALPFSFYFATKQLTKTTSLGTPVVIGFILNLLSLGVRFLAPWRHTKDRKRDGNRK